MKPVIATIYVVSTAIKSITKLERLSPWNWLWWKCTYYDYHYAKPALWAFLTCTSSAYNYTSAYLFLNVKIFCSNILNCQSVHLGLIIEAELRLGKGSEIEADGRIGVVAAGSLGEMKKTSKVTLQHLEGCSSGLHKGRSEGMK